MHRDAAALIDAPLALDGERSLLVMRAVLLLALSLLLLL